MSEWETVIPAPPAQPNLDKPGVLDRVVGNIMGGLAQTAAFPIAIPALVNTLRGERDTWSQRFMEGLNKAIAEKTGVPTEERTLLDEAMGFAAPASIVTAPVRLGTSLGARIASGAANVMVPTTTAGPGVGARMAANIAVPTAITGAVDAALGGGMLERTAEQLNPMSTASAQALTPPPVPPPAPPVAPPVPPPAPGPVSGSQGSIPAARSEWVTLPVKVAPASDTSADVDTGGSGLLDFATSPLGALTVGAGLLFGGAKVAQKIARARNTVPGQVDETAKLAGKITDRSVPITRAMQDAGIPEAVVERVNSIMHLHGNMVPRVTRYKHMADTGDIEGFGRVVVSNNGRQQTLNEFLNEFTSFTPDVQAGIRRALQIGTELDNRASGVNAGQGLKPILQGTDTDLSIERANLMSNPVVANYLERYNQFNYIARDYLVHTGLLTRGEAARLANANPRYVMYRWLGPLARREEALGDLSGVTIPERFGTGDPIGALADYWGDIMHAAARNHSTRTVMNELGGTQYVQRLTTKPPTNINERELTVHWRDGGQDLYAVMSDPALATAIRNEPMLGDAVWQHLNALRRVEQSAYTGTLGALTGNLFQPITAIYTAGAGQFTHPSGRSLGVISNAMQKYLGFAGRGDPTVAAQMVGAFARDVTRQGELSFAKHLAYDLDRNGWITQSFGQGFTRTLAQRMMDDYRQSSLAAMRKFGAAHVNLHGTADESFGEGMRIAKDYLKSIAPEVNHPRLAPAYRGRAALENILELVASSTNSAYWKQNRGRVSDEILASETRKLGGDPAIIGSSAGMQKAASTIPYLNTATQGMRALFNAARDRPAASSAAGIVMFGVVPYLYQEYLKELGPEYINHYWQERTAYDRGSRLPLYIPGVPPEQAPKAPLFNEAAPFMSAAMRYFGDMNGNTTGVTAADADELKARLSFGSWEDTKAAMSRVNPASLPMAARIPLAGMGVNVDSLMRMDARPITGMREAGTRANPDNIVDGVLGSRAEHMMKQIPAVGQIMIDAFNELHIGGGVEGVVGRQGMRVADRNALVSPLWGMDQALRSQTVDSKLLTQRVGRMREMVEEFNKRNKQFEFFRAGVPLEGRGPAPMNLDTAIVFKRVGDALRQLEDPNGGILAQRNVVLRNISALDGTNMSATERRQRQNELTREANDLTVRALDKISELNSIIGSFTNGGTIDTINPNRNLDGSRFWDGSNAIVK